MFSPLFSRMPLNALRTFESAARLNSFKAAALELSVTPSAVSHQVKTLEAWLGQRLFERVNQGVALTATGASVFQEVHRGLLALDQALAPYHASPPNQSLGITTTPAFAALWLIPRLGSFYLQHPAIDLKVESSNQVIDLLREANIDVAIRSTRRTSTELYDSPLLEEHFGVYAAPALAADTRPTALINVTWSTSDAADVNWQEWCRRAGVPEWVRSCRLLDYEDEHYALQAAIAGQGHILASNVLAHDSVRRGLLVPCRREVVLPSSPYRLLCRPGREREQAIQHFFSWISVQTLD